MLSLILSRLFRLGFFIVVLFGALGVLLMVIQKPIKLYENSSVSYFLGNPNLHFKGSRFIATDKPAPDTMVRYTIKEKNRDFQSETGELHPGAPGYEPVKKRFDSMYISRQKNGDSILLDTQLTLIRNMHINRSSTTNVFSTVTSSQALPDGRVVNTTISTGAYGKPVGAMQKDTFANKLEANIFFYTGNKRDDYLLTSDGLLEETIGIRPVGAFGQFVFILYALLEYLFIALLMLLLSRLFYNFYKGGYFTPGNVRIIRNTGWCLLIPQFLCLAFYRGFLYYIHPVKLSVTGGQAFTTSSYILYSGMDWTLVFLGLGLLVLSFIFKNGLELKQDQASII